MKTSKTVAKLLFVVGALVYLVGLWISCPLLSGKGYFLGVLMDLPLYFQTPVIT
ncbi:Inner membrane protein yiaB [Escherichia coli]|nr:Inner membrane protein yiaB [Escherichia coli]VWM67992.1 Inner membrane protein yiaB [Escherichia coli]